MPCLQSNLPSAIGCFKDVGGRTIMTFFAHVDDFVNVKYRLLTSEMGQVYCKAVTNIDVPSSRPKLSYGRLSICQPKNACASCQHQNRTVWVYQSFYNLT